MSFLAAWGTCEKNGTTKTCVLSRAGRALSTPSTFGALPLSVPRWLRQEPPRATQGWGQQAE